jgi:hypothetical protein
VRLQSRPGSVGALKAREPQRLGEGRSSPFLRMYHDEQTNGKILLYTRCGAGNGPFRMAN